MYMYTDIPQKIKIEIAYGPATPLLGISRKEMKIGYQRELCTAMFIAALFTVAKKWKWSSCPLTGEWMNKMYDIHTMEYYLGIKKEWSSDTCYDME